MAEKDTVMWAEQHGYYECWLLPQWKINKDISTFKGCPVGNLPEFIPLDNSLDNDIQASMSLHCSITSHLPDIDPEILSSTHINAPSQHQIEYRVPYVKYTTQLATTYPVYGE